MAKHLDLSHPRDSQETLDKILQHAEPNKPTFTWFGGLSFAIRGDIQPIESLFKVEGVKVSTTGEEYFFFKDQSTDAFISTWKNPFNDKTVDVKPLKRQTVAMQQNANMPWYIGSDNIVAVLEQHGVGRNSSFKHIVAPRKEVEDKSVLSTSFVGTWQSNTQWWDWMEMGDIEGYLFSRLFLRKYSKIGDLPSPLLEQIKSHFPEVVRS